MEKTGEPVGKMTTMLILNHKANTLCWAGIPGDRWSTQAAGQKMRHESHGGRASPSPDLPSPSSN